MAEKRRKCENNSDVFCYICGKYTLQQKRGKITDFVKKAYCAYFSLETKINLGLLMWLTSLALNIYESGQMEKEKLDKLLVFL